MTQEKPTLWPPLDNTVEGGYKGLRVHIPEFQTAFEWHDDVYTKIWEGTFVTTLKEADDCFHWQMLTITSSMPAEWQRVKLGRYAHYCYGAARAWATIVRPTFEAWKPGDPPLKEMYA